MNEICKEELRQKTISSKGVDYMVYVCKEVSTRIGNIVITKDKQNNYMFSGLSVVNAISENYVFEYKSYVNILKAFTNKDERCFDSYILGKKLYKGYLITETALNSLLFYSSLSNEEIIIFRKELEQIKKMELGICAINF